MIKLIFLVLLLLHGVIHLIGFAKAYDLAELSQLTRGISRPVGAIWLVATLTFLVTAALLISRIDWWWIPGIVAVAVSQGLIIGHWSDARWGTLLNLIIVVGLIVGFGSWNFDREIRGDIGSILPEPGSRRIEEEVTGEMIDSLPKPVSIWLKRTGIQGREIPKSVYLEQSGRMRLNPDQSWQKSEAIQYVRIDEPGFVWKVDMKMFSVIPVKGRDKFVEGEGAMTIRLASLVPVVNVSGNDKIDEAALQRYLAELVWYPNAAFSPYVTWEGVDERTARATMEYMGTSGSVTFHFTDDGDVSEVSAERYKGAGEESERKDWLVTIAETELRNGIRVPTSVNVSWVLDGEPFTWYEFEIGELSYNPAEQDALI